uniref:Homoserine dehydrogenase, NAD-binding protein n=1 Tax=Mycolicibacterium gilvum (strain PYR-GCK) TaxID=350054 RepID=A4TAQ6_MYCGI|nr:homoserine dehydrogenase, NAD-binding protein [Mycolicibacterium gilvum PYR-GCK]
MKKLRVIQWTTGKVGRLSMRGILDDPRLELVGVYAYSAEKAGADAGPLCGRPETGVRATTDIDALIALNADTVLYTPFMADLDHAVRLLESGLDVISTNLFLNVGGIQGETRDKLAAACEQGNSSLYITGVNPGWINTMVTAMTAVCRDVQKVSIVESADVSVYESAETWQALGMGQPEVTPEVAGLAEFGFTTFAESVQRMALALGFDLDEMEFVVEHQTASERVDLGWFCMEKDTIAAIRGGWNAKVKGKTVIESRVAWYLTDKLNGGWVFDDDHYHVVIAGEPEVQTRIRFVPPEHWGNHEWDTMTAMPAVNAAHNVAAAPAGILTLQDVGLPCAPAGPWESERRNAPIG